MSFFLVNLEGRLHVDCNMLFKSIHATITVYKEEIYGTSKFLRLFIGAISTLIDFEDFLQIDNASYFSKLK